MGRVKSFFPFLLLILNVSHFTSFFIIWVLLFLIIGGKLGEDFGVPYLILNPEFKGESSFWAYLILGFSIGGFMFYYNISFYVCIFHKIPFLLTLRNPLTYFTINNLILPVSFLIFLFYHVLKFNLNEEEASLSLSFLNVFGLISGIICFFSIGWFSIIIVKNPREEQINKQTIVAPVTYLLGKPYEIRPKETYIVRTYLTPLLKIKPARNPLYYSDEIINKIITKHKINLTLFEILLIISFFSMNFISNKITTSIPAGACLMLLLTFLGWIIAVLHSWIRNWTLPIIILGIPTFLYIKNFLHFDFLIGKNINNLTIPTKQINKKEVYDLLYKWKKDKGVSNILFICASGGGLKATMWSYLVNSYLDSITNGKYSRHILHYAGISGGGVAFAGLYKFWRNNTIPPLSFTDTLGFDLLNPIISTLISNDLIVPLKKYQIDDIKIPYNRGIAFELSLLKNSSLSETTTIDSIFYATTTSIVPYFSTMVAEKSNSTPIIISSFPFPYGKKDWNFIGSNFSVKNKNYPSLPLIRVIRAATSVPFIMPTMFLAPNLKKTLIDGGFLDNYGVLITIQLISDFEDVFLNLFNKIGIIIIRPTFYGGEFFSSSLFKSQREHQHLILETMEKKLKGKFHWFIIEFGKNNEKISLSWRLTKKEKKAIWKSLNDSLNQNTFKEIINFLNE